MLLFSQDLFSANAASTPQDYNQRISPVQRTVVARKVQNNSITQTGLDNVNKGSCKQRFL